MSKRIFNLHTLGPVRGAGRLVPLALDLFYPPRCGGCDRRGTWFCDECHAAVVPARPRALSGVDIHTCAGVFTGPLRTAIHRLKYDHDAPLAKPLCQLAAVPLLQEVQAQLRLDDRPEIVPVPLHPDRERERGYNQAKLLADELVRISGFRLSQGLVRTRFTRSQVGLTHGGRAENVRGAFEGTGKARPAAHVILLDDVCTTGATLSECAHTLRAAGAKTVWAATVASAEFPAGDR